VAAEEGVVIDLSKMMTNKKLSQLKQKSESIKREQEETHHLQQNTIKGGS
jgi:hypothetical protein